MKQDPADQPSAADDVVVGQRLHDLLAARSGGNHEGHRGLGRIGCLAPRVPTERPERQGPPEQRYHQEDGYYLAAGVLLARPFGSWGLSHPGEDTRGLSPNRAAPPATIGGSL